MRAPRPGGLHRIGATPRAWRRRLHDRHARAEAEQLAERWPHWIVIYGPWSRKFYAMASWPAPDRLMVDAATAEELETLMNEAETAAALRTPASERRLP